MFTKEVKAGRCALCSSVLVRNCPAPFSWCHQAARLLPLGRFGACGGQRYVSPINICSAPLSRRPPRTHEPTHTHSTGWHCASNMVDNQGLFVLSSVRAVKLSRVVSKLQATGTQTNTQRAHLRPSAERHLSVTVGEHYSWNTHTHAQKSLISGGFFFHKTRLYVDK